MMNVRTYYKKIRGAGGEVWGMARRVRPAGLVMGLAGVVAGFCLAAVAVVRSDDGKIGVRQVRDLLRHLGGADFRDEQIEIRRIGGGVAGDVVVEARIETAYRLRREKDRWKVAEMRLGDRHWESMELIEEAVRREKTRRTLTIIEQLSAGLAAYRAAEGRFVAAEGIAGLLDALSPRYVAFPHRLDLWGTELHYEGTAARYSLRSAGPDRKIGTEDDLVSEGRIG